MKAFPDKIHEDCTRGLYFLIERKLTYKLRSDSLLMIAWNG